MSDQLLTGWGRTAPTRATVVPVSSVGQVAEFLESAGPRGVLARGLGRSYGDAAQNAGGTVLDLRSLPLPGTHHTLDLDRTSGMARCSAGLSLHDLIRQTLPYGWFPPVTPGTRWVTVGGAVAADVHGKNHHVDGSFADFVRSLTVVTPAHGPVTVSRSQNPGLFWATIGGMGLTGILTEVQLQLRSVSSTTVDADTDRCDTLDDLLMRVREHERRRRYCVAWIDVLSNRGRGVVTSADHTPSVTGSSQLSERVPATRVVVPFLAPVGTLSKTSIGAFNELWFRRAPRHDRDAQVGLWRFFYPLDGVGAWNRLYGWAGLLQYQVVVPKVDALTQILELLQRHGVPVFLAVLKSFGQGNTAPLSFPASGWTLAVDMPRNTAGLPELLDRLDAVTVDAGGRTYLAKDGRVRPELVPVMYPRLDEWRAVRDEVDPEHVMASDLSRRLAL